MISFPFRMLTIAAMLYCLFEVRAASASEPPETEVGSRSEQAVAEPVTSRPVRTRPNKALIMTGGITLGVSYGAALLTSVIYLIGVYPIPALICEAADPGECSPQAAPLWLTIPGAGPFLAASSLSAPRSGRINMFEDNPSTKTLFYVDGALQLAGLGLFTAGFLFRENVGPPAVAASHGTPGFWLVPQPIPGGALLRAALFTP